VTPEEMDCEQALKHLLEYVDRELGDDVREGMERHLRTCRSCFSRMEFERQLKDRIHGLSLDSAPAGARDRIRALIRGF
jgi:anti-sigma factor (TIGR02949 family)